MKSFIHGLQKYMKVVIFGKILVEFSVSQFDIYSFFLFIYIRVTNIVCKYVYVVCVHEILAPTGHYCSHSGSYKLAYFFGTWLDILYYTDFCKLLFCPIQDVTWPTYIYYHYQFNTVTVSGLVFCLEEKGLFGSVNKAFVWWNQEPVSIARGEEKEKYIKTEHFRITTGKNGDMEQCRVCSILFLLVKLATWTNIRVWSIWNFLGHFIPFYPFHCNPQGSFYGQISI